MLETRRMPGSFGIEVLGFDLKAAMPDDIAEIVALFHANQVIAIREQELEPEDFAKYGTWLGRPHPHVLQHGRLEGHPTISVLQNEADNPRLNGAAFWHTDNSYEQEPASATTLYAVNMPERGGETLVADMYRAFDALPAEMREELDGLEVLHVYGNRDAGKDGELEAAKPTTDQWKELPAVRHPLVMRHPITGRKALYGVSGSSRGIVGMGEAEGTDLLGKLKSHATKPEFVIEVGYRVGDVAAWDTLATLHSAKPQPPSREAETLRKLLRITVKGQSPMAQLAT